MCDFMTLTDDEKRLHHLALLRCAESFGGKNFFLHLLEAIRETKPHPLIAAHHQFRMDLGTITWNKVIFNDKLQLLFTARVLEGKQGNFLPPKEDKQYKKVLNLVRTLSPITFEITPADAKNGAGCTVRPFDRIDAETTRLNPLFDALFFCAIDTVKKVLNYTPRSDTPSTDETPKDPS